MAIITEELIKGTAALLLNDREAAHDGRAFNGTITFKDDEGYAYLSWFHGRLMEAQAGECVFGTDFTVVATNEGWDKAFHEDERKGPIDLNGGYVKFEGSLYGFAGQAKLFNDVWKAMRMVYLRRSE